MKQQLRFLMLTLLCAVFSAAWATEETTTYTFTSNKWAAEPDDWTSGKAGNQLTQDRGVQITTGTSGANATSPVSFKDISQVVVTYSTNASKGKGSVKIKIGNNTEISKNVDANGGTTDRELTFSYDPTQTGTVKLTVECSENSIYIKSIAITTNSSSTGPVEANPTFKEDPFYVKIGNKRTNEITKPGNLTVTYSSGDEAIASVDETSGEVTGVESGQTTITASWSQSSSYIAGSKSYTVIVPQRENPQVSFANESLEVEVNNYIRNTLNSPEGLTFSYSSEDETIATVAADGLVTGVSVGTTTITASWEKTNTYSEGSASFTIVVMPEKPSTVFTKVISFDQLVAGKQYIIVADNYNTAMGQCTGSSTTSFMAKVDITKNGDKIKIRDNQGVNILTLGGETGTWTFKTSIENKYLNCDDTGNYLLLSDDASSNTSSWTITDDYQVKNNQYVTRIIRYNSNQPRFACYKGTQQKAVLYVKEDPITATFNPKYKGFTSIYYADKNLKVPEDVTAHTYKVVNGKGEYITNITAGEVIPQGTPVMLEYGKEFNENVTVTFEEVETATPLNDGNMLRGSDDVDANGYTTAPNDGNAADYYFYVLSVGQNENAGKIGFYWKLENGAPFQPTPHKIYLALLKSEVDAAGASMISILDDSNGINTIAAGDNTTQEVYSLSGVRMNGNHLPKGIYIIGGKKVVVK